jgi:YfiH family protein
MFYEDSRHVYRTATLDRLPWIDYGFGTRLSESWVPGPLAWVHQVHSDRSIDANGAAGCLGDADALITATPGVYVSIRTADCIPILLADERLRVVAAVHAGWRGSAERIAEKVVERMKLSYGSRPEDLVAAIGPGICGGCYEVGPEVAERFGVDATHLDLAEANRKQLIEAGLDERRIAADAPCTACNPDWFFSWRRDRSRAGRMVSAIAISG